MALLFCDGFDHWTYCSGSDTGEGPATAFPYKWDAAFAAGSFRGGGSWDFVKISASYGRPSLGDSLTGGFLAGASDQSDAVASSHPCSLVKNLGKNASTLYVGFAYKFYQANRKFPIGNTVILNFADGTQDQCQLCINTIGQLYFRKANAATFNTSSTAWTAIGSASSNVLNANVWRYLEVQVTFSTSGTGTLILKVDGVTWITLTSITNTYSANAWANRVFIGSMSVADNSNNWYAPSDAAIDDLYICDNTGTVGNTFLGDVRIRALAPSGLGTQQDFTYQFASWPTSTATPVGTTISDGTHIQRVISISGTGTTGATAPTWNATVGGNTTDNSGTNQVIWLNLGTPAAYLAINEGTPDNDYSYISSNTVGNISRFTYPSTSGSAVFGVVVFMSARKDDSGFRAIRGACKSGSSTSDNGSDLYLSNSSVFYPAIFYTDPATGVAWTISGVNAAEFGVKLTV